MDTYYDDYCNENKLENEFMRVSRKMLYIRRCSSLVMDLNDLDGHLLDKVYINRRPELAPLSSITSTQENGSKKTKNN